VPKRNYGQAKREREVARQQKKADKLQRKLERSNPAPATTDPAEGAAPEALPSD
jgi:hypothetical protein